jgi:hypothetical protein
MRQPDARADAAGPGSSCTRWRRTAPPGTLLGLLATWRSGYAAACKAVYTGSIPVVALKNACK